MSQLPFLSELNEITVDRPHTLGSLALALYGHVSPLGKATPRKWLAIFLANRAKSGWYLDPNMPIAAGTTLLVPPAPSAHYPQLIDGTYFNAAFGYRMKLNANWTVDEGDGTAVVDLLIQSGLARSKGEARRDIQGGGIYLNNERVTDADQVASLSQTIEGQFLILRKGRKRYHLMQVMA